MARLSREQLGEYARKIHARAKKLKQEDGDRKMYKVYVKEASAQLKAEGAFSKKRKAKK